MPKLTVIYPDGTSKTVCFEGNPRLFDLLRRENVPVDHPCGGRGICGKCRVDVTGDLSPLSEDERRASGRLSCQTRLSGDATLRLSDDKRIEVEFYAGRVESTRREDGCGVALDVGTTTLALQVLDLSAGEAVGRASARNPQISFSADVIGRIQAALSGEAQALRDAVAGACAGLLDEALARAGRSRADVRDAVVTGNTAMLHLLCGRSVEPLSHAPFRADCLFDETVDLFGIPAYLPPCMDAFVGADISCAVLSTDLCRHGTALLADVGTNGELALAHGGHLFVTSTAAGPAFEGEGISCGMTVEPGAITRVSADADGRLRLTTVAGAPARGVCGSGLLDAIAVFLAQGRIDGSGAAAGDLTLAPGVALTPRDVRAVQLAKAAISAGIQTLLRTAGADPDEVERLCLAGGFGSRFSVASAAAIGLLPSALVPRVEAVGNAALAGATRLLLDPPSRDRLRAILRRAVPVRLSGNPLFAEHYMDAMAFSDD